MSAVTPSAISSPVTVTIYRVTGQQLFFRVAKPVCEACDLTVSAAIRAIHELDGIEARLIVRPWLNYLPLALMQGALHPPVLLVNGEVVSQGFVPTVEGVKTAIILAAESIARFRPGSAMPQPRSGVDPDLLKSRIA